MPSYPAVFVSHSHKDNAFGMRLIGDLRAKLGDSNVWYDVSGGLHGGDEWWREIVRQITARDVFLVILSPNALASPFVQREMAMAYQLHLTKQKRLLPIRYQPCNLAIDWEIIHWLPCRDPQADAKGYTYDVAAILADLLSTLPPGQQPLAQPARPAPTSVAPAAPPPITKIAANWQVGKSATQPTSRRFWPFGRARQGQATTQTANQGAPTVNGANARIRRTTQAAPLHTQQTKFSGWRLGLSLTISFILALAALVALVALQHLAVPLLLALFVAPAPYGLLALALLAVCALIPWLGAGAITGAWRTASRRLTTTLGALIGLGAALLIESHWLFTGARHALLIGASGAPLELAIVPPALVSLGAALGADPVGSRWALNVIRFTAQHPYLCVMPIVIALGAWAGFAGATRLPPMLWGDVISPNSFLINVLGVIGLVIGVIVGAALTNPTCNLLSRIANVRP